MTLEQLKTFHSIITTGSFRAASESLNRAQSAVSYAIRTLEDELEFPLFDRSQYRPVLTPMGRAFHQKTVEFLTQFEQLEQAAQYLKRGHEPVLRIGVSALFPLDRLSEVLCRLRGKFSDTEIKIYQEVMSALELLESEKVDLALSAFPGENDKLVHASLFDVTLVNVCSPKHELAKLKGKAKDTDLRLYPQIILRSTVESSRRAGIINPSNTISVGEFLSKKTLIEQGVGWGSMPEHLVKEDIKRKDLVITHSATVVVPMQIAHKKDRPLGPCGQFLWSEICKKIES